MGFGPDQVDVLIDLSGILPGSFDIPPFGIPPAGINAAFDGQVRPFPVYRNTQVDGDFPGFSGFLPAYNKEQSKCVHRLGIRVRLQLGS